jgi:hypothetical protein
MHITDFKRLLLGTIYKEPVESKANSNIQLRSIFTLFSHLHLNFPKGIFLPHFLQNALLLILRNPQLQWSPRLLACMKSLCRNASGASADPNDIINDISQFPQVNARQESERNYKFIETLVRKLERNGPHRRYKTEALNSIKMGH